MRTAEEWTCEMVLKISERQEKVDASAMMRMLADAYTEGRRAGLEEAAQVCLAQRPCTSPDFYGQQIRALIDKKPTPA